MTLSEKSAYLKGLMEGMNLNTETNEGKMISKIVELLDEMALSIGDIEDTTIAISDELDQIEDDLDAIEDYIMDDDEDDEDYDEDEEDDDDLDEIDDFDYDDDTVYEVTCPKCGHVLELDEETLVKGGVSCPECKEPLEFEFDEDDEEDSF